MKRTAKSMRLPVIKSSQKRSLHINVRKVATGIYAVESLSNDRLEYNVRVTRRGDYIRALCNCSWAQHNGEGCTHSLAVFRYLAKQKGKRLSFWTDEEKAHKQRRKVIRLGQHLWATVRYIKRKESINGSDNED